MTSSPQDSPPISLLCVDDDLGVLDILKKYFERVPDFSVFTCSTAAEALELIRQYQFDAIISDYAMPDMDGIKFLKTVRSQNDPSLFIIFTGRHIAQVAIEALNNGGNYYVQKGVNILSEMPKVEDFIRRSVLSRRKEHSSTESEARYHALLEQQTDLLCSFLPDGSCTHANEAYARFIGRIDEEIAGTNFLATIPRAEREKITMILQELSPAEPGTYIEHHAMNSKGEPRLYQWGYHAFFNEDGTVMEYLAQGRDLSNVLRLDEILSPTGITADTDESQPIVSPGMPITAISPELSNLADSVEQIQYPIFAIDKNGIVIAWNHAMAELTGVDARTMIGLGDYSYAFPIYGEPRPMLIDYILRAATGSSHEVFPGLVRDGDSYCGDVEEVTIHGRKVQVWGKGTPIFDGRGTVIAALQSLLVHEKYPSGEENTGDEQYLGGVSSIILKVAAEGLGGSIAGAIGYTTGGYGVYATDRRLIVVHNPELDASRDNGIQFGEFIIDELFGVTVDMRPRSIPDLERIKVFEVWRDDITAIELKTPRFLAGFLIIRVRDGSSFRIFVDHTKAFLHLEQLLNMFYPSAVKKVEEITDAELEWLDEVRTLELIGKLQLEDPFQDFPHISAASIPKSLARTSSVSVSQDRGRLLGETIEEVAYPVFAIDRQGIVIAWNKAMTRLTGIEAAEMIGTGEFNYSFPFYGERRPMLIDYLIMPPDSAVQGELPEITRDGDTIIGSLESVTIRGKPMLVWGKATAISDAKGSVIAAVQSLLFSEQPSVKTTIRNPGQEQYLGGLSSTTVRVPREGIAGSIAGAIGSTTGGYGVYFTDQRMFVIHNPDLDADHRSGLQFGDFILDELFGTTVDTTPRTTDELTRMRVFEVPRKDILSIEMKKPMLFSGYFTFKIRGGEMLRVYTDHKKAYIHIEQLFRIFYPEILRIE
jgi:PAS domain S-box-containing protein